MSIRIAINGKNVMVDADGKSYKMLRDALAVVAKTSNIDAKGPQDVVESIAKTGKAFADKPDTDIIEIYETPETKGATESLLARGKVKNLGYRILDALQANRRKMDFVAKSESTKGDTSGAQQVTEFTY